jgi:AI-2 transport protein TqsA
VLLTLVLALCVNPVRGFLRSRGIPPSVATLAMMLLMFAVLAAFAATVFVAVTEFVAMLPGFSDEFAALGASTAAFLRSIGLASTEATEVARSIEPRSILTAANVALGGVFGFTGALVIVLTMIILMSADAVYVPLILGQLGERRPHLVTALRRYSSDVRRYMVVTALLGVAQGALNALALWLMQVPAALLWGVLAFLCSFIPNVGYFVALVPPLVFGFLVGGWPTLVAIVVVYAVINAVVQSIIQPRIVGQAVSLSQTVTFFSVLFWAVVIGPVGAILAIPLTLLAKAVLVDANPPATLWRPAFGPTAETRALQKAEEAGRKDRRRSGSRGSSGLRRPPTDTGAP